MIKHKTLILRPTSKENRKSVKNHIKWASVKLTIRFSVYKNIQNIAFISLKQNYRTKIVWNSEEIWYKIKVCALKYK